MAPISPLSSSQVAASNGKDVANGNKVNLNNKPVSSYFGRDSQEVTRLIIQALDDLGYDDISNLLINRSGYNIETNQVKQFRSSILNGDWDLTEKLLSSLDLDACGSDSREATEAHANFLIRRQEYLEYLEDGNVTAALDVLQHKLSPLGIHKSELHALSELSLVGSGNELKQDINWNGVESRQTLLQGLQDFLSPSVMIPPHRLATLLDQAVKYQIDRSNYWVNDDVSRISLCRDFQDKRENFPVRTSHVLSKHKDEVWHVSFSHDGTRMVSASKDNTVIIWDAETFDPDTCMVIDAHNRGVLAAEWSPDDKYLLTSSTDYHVKLWDPKTGDLITEYAQHSDVVSSIAWYPDSKRFVSGSPDKKLILWNINGEMVHLWESNRVMNLQISPDGKRMVVLCYDNVINIFNLETNILENSIAMDRVLSCVSFSRNSRYALINIAKDEVFLWDLDTLRIAHKYVGQQQTEFMIRSCFGGAAENFILSGSEDANIYVWSRHTTELIEVLSGHKGTVNCVKWHPLGRPLFASAGDDCTIRIWEPETASS